MQLCDTTAIIAIKIDYKTRISYEIKIFNVNVFYYDIFEAKLIILLIGYTVATEI